MKYFLIGRIITFSSVFASESFSYKDWELVCDNTHTCRMVGYTEYTTDEIYFPLSLYFERNAGKNSLIKSKIAFADYPENVDEKRLKNNLEDIKYISHIAPKTVLKVCKMVGKTLNEDIVFYKFNRDYIEGISEKVQLKAVMYNGYLIKYFKNPVKKLQFAAVKESGEAIQYIQNLSENVQMQAIKQNENMIKYIQNPSKKIKSFLNKELL